VYEALVVVEEYEYEYVILLLELDELLEPELELEELPG
jgi:hypothetical protein